MEKAAAATANKPNGRITMRLWGDSLVATNR